MRLQLRLLLSALRCAAESERVEITGAAAARTELADADAIAKFSRRPSLCSTTYESYALAACSSSTKSPSSMISIRSEICACHGFAFDVAPLRK